MKHWRHLWELTFDSCEVPLSDLSILDFRIFNSHDQMNVISKASESSFTLVLPINIVEGDSSIKTEPLLSALSRHTFASERQ